MEMFPSHLGGLEERTRTLLERSGTELCHARERTVCWQGDPVTHVYLVRSGRARLVKHRSDGSSMLLGWVEAGGWIALPEAMAGVSHLCDVEAEAACHLFSLAVPALQRIAARPDFSSWLQRELALAACRLHGHLEAKTPQEKIRQFLALRGGSAASGPGGRDALVSIEITQDQLAQAVGFTRETVNRTLKDLEDAAVLRLERGRIEVNLARLKGDPMLFPTK